jgi:hypothetical protein
MGVELEALSRVHAEQGFLILASFNRYETGRILLAGGQIYKPSGEPVSLHQPMKVIGSATEDEFLRQDARLLQLIGVEYPDRFYPLRPFLYKVVACD